MPNDPNDLHFTEEEWKALLEGTDLGSSQNSSPNQSSGPSHWSRLRTRGELDEAYPSQRRDLMCPECGAEMLLKDSRNGVFYGCVTWHNTRCKGSHSAHQGTGLPMGVPATKDTKKLRQDAHLTFDQLWKTGRMKRKEAYTWLADKMGLDKDQAHIGAFDDNQCRQVIKIVERELKPINRFEQIDEWDD